LLLCRALVVNKVPLVPLVNVDPMVLMDLLVHPDKMDRMVPLVEMEYLAPLDCL